MTICRKLIQFWMIIASGNDSSTDYEKSWPYREHVRYKLTRFLKQNFHVILYKTGLNLEE